jgi:WW domain-binding protein 2
MPWFGSNSWQAVLQPVPGGNIPSSHAKVEVKLVFNEGGAADFHSNFERIKERLQQAVEAAREGDSRPGHGIGSLAGVNMDAVHLDQLPTYEASGQDPIAPISPGSALEEPPMALSNVRHISRDGAGERSPQATPTTAEPPNEPPPGYEETQQQSIQQEFERRFSGQE